MKGIFENNDSTDSMKASILISENTNNKISIVNSVFKNNTINQNIPFFYLSRTNMM